MTPAHIHLILNHVPILGTYFGIAPLVLALMRRSDELNRVALGVFVVAALFTIPVYLTGQPAEHAIEGAPGLSEAVIGPHEDASHARATSAGYPRAPRSTAVRARPTPHSTRSPSSPMTRAAT